MKAASQGMPYDYSKMSPDAIEFAIREQQIRREEREADERHLMNLYVEQDIQLIGLSKQFILQAIANTYDDIMLSKSDAICALTNLLRVKQNSNDILTCQDVDAIKRDCEIIERDIEIIKQDINIVKQGIGIAMYNLYISMSDIDNAKIIFAHKHTDEIRQLNDAIPKQNDEIIRQSDKIAKLTAHIEELEDILALLNNSF